MCGYPLNNIGYVVVTENDVTNRYGELHTAGSGPLHLSCALYAMAACPFLRYRTSRRRVTGDTHRGAASIHGFDHYGVFFPPDPRIFMLFGYYDPIETVQLTNQTHVAELYEAAVTATAATAFTIGSRLYWTDAADNLRRLNADWPKQWTTLQAWAQTSTVTIDGRTYRGRLLDNSGDLPSPKFFHHPPKRDVRLLTKVLSVW